MQIYSPLKKFVNINPIINLVKTASGSSNHEFLEVNVEDLKNDNATKKDSGLESGEVSDSCDSGKIQ